MDNNLYEERDIIQLDVSGNFYCQHVHHMTSESLHSKSDIAAELGYRDFCISELQKDNENLRAMMRELEIQRDKFDAMLTEAVQSLKETEIKRDALTNQLNRYSMSAGEADQRMNESRYVREALGFKADADDVSPRDLVEAIAEVGAKAVDDFLKSGRKFFMHSDETGFEKHKTSEEAIRSAQEMIDACREDADDGWPEETDTICWGVIIQMAEETDFQKPSEDNGFLGSSDYKLRGGGV
ncbi:hypothetical protein WCT81_04595 [Pectobacterium versatile]|uniref:hypothetical protein n=1 Tax=Pectobacterium versatile TaxID=2488639 RepID=UPI0030164DB1